MIRNDRVCGKVRQERDVELRLWVEQNVGRDTRVKRREDFGDADDRRVHGIPLVVHIPEGNATDGALCARCLANNDFAILERATSGIAVRISRQLAGIRGRDAVEQNGRRVDSADDVPLNVGSLPDDGFVVGEGTRERRTEHHRARGDFMTHIRLDDRIHMILLIDVQSFVDTILDLIVIDVDLEHGLTQCSQAVFFEVVARCGNRHTGIYSLNISDGERTGRSESVYCVAPTCRDCSTCCDD